MSKDDVEGLPKTVGKFTISDPDECWEWKGSLTSKGYGSCYYKGRNRGAHRVVYEFLVGKVPEGLQLDHLCRNRKCVNPKHLEPVTGKVNVLRSNAVSAINTAKTHCPRGHALEGENLAHWLLTVKGWRWCRTCKNLNRRIIRQAANQKQL